MVMKTDTLNICLVSVYLGYQCSQHQVVLFYCVTFLLSDYMTKDEIWISLNQEIVARF